MAEPGCSSPSNTIGAIVGTFLVPFVVIPLIGSPDALALIAMVNAGLAIVLAACGAGSAGRPSRPAIAGSGAACVVLVLVVAVAGGRSFVDPSVARIERSGGTDPASRPRTRSRRSRPGSTANGNKHLWVTGTSMTLLTVDAKLMPILPLIARPDAKTAAVVAFGMGSAYPRRAHRRAPRRRRRARAVGPDDVRDLLRRRGRASWPIPNGRVIVADGRNHIELTDRRYDIIVTDPPPPVESAGVSVISSREYYQAGKARLNPGGVMMQWLPWSGQRLDEFLAHVRSFRAVFPEVIDRLRARRLRRVHARFGRADLVRPGERSTTVLARPGVTEDLSSAFDSPAHDAAGWAARIPSLVWISGDDVARVVGDGPLITDDRPLPEYFLLRHAFGPSSPRVEPALLRQLSASP